MLDKKTFVLAVAVSWVLTLVTIVLISNFAPNLLQPFAQTPSETTDDDLIIIDNQGMEPALKLGDVVRIDRQISIDGIHVGSKDDDPPGDILAYQGATELIVHRAIDKKIGTDGKIIFIMHGDANADGANEHVHENKIVGKVVEIITSSEK